MKMIVFSTLVLLLLYGCVERSSVAQKTVPAESGATEATTPLTDENYALAESQIIFAGYMNKIAAATNTNGVGILMHNKKGADPKDRAVMRINFDTLYSFALLDLSEEARLTLPETNGRYQSAWMITEEHYNPMAITTPGVHKLNMSNVGSRYAMVVIRTQANTVDPEDLAAANALQDQLRLEQDRRGSYQASNKWNMGEVLKMRARYMQMLEQEGIASTEVFGKKGEVPLKLHNVGTAYGWGGFTPDQAVYLPYVPDTTAPQTLTLKDVPANAFWSITVYDAEGYVQGEIYNINSQFAVADKAGVVTLHFGGDERQPNYMDIYQGWNFVLRLYQPTEAYFNGAWLRPELVAVN